MSVDIARTIAYMAHRGQKDKAGDPYIGHPARVAAKFPNRGDEILQEVAWLHDVLEDSDITGEDLAEAGISARVIEAVKLLSRDDETPADEYYAKIRVNYYARQVKIADIMDNVNLSRLSRLDDKTIVRLVKKYAHALEELSK